MSTDLNSNIDGFNNTHIDGQDEEWILRLYIAGMTPKCTSAFTNLKTICEDNLKGKYQIEVIDLLVDPQMGHNDHILAIPTLVRRLPGPVRKIIGDLSNKERVLVGLDIETNTHSEY